jgi:predicted phage terminase large subunit-like protein
LELALADRFARKARASQTVGGAPERLGFLDFFDSLHARVGWERPEHLLDLVSQVESAETRPIRALVSVPPRHGKTVSLLSTIAWWLQRHPEQTIAYVSYSADIARSKSRLARDYARQVGIKIRNDSDSLGEWRTHEGGGVLAVGVGGALTGWGAHLLLCDDVHKNRAEAESSKIRDTIAEWFTSTAMTRIEPGGSVIVCNTRWHPDDLIGRLERDAAVRWDRVNLPAIDDSGEALWPSRWPVEALRVRQAEVGEYDWASLYQGQPRPRGGAVFRDVRFCDELPTSGYKVSIGLDLAYSSRTQADYSVAVVMLECAGLYYVADVIRVQLETTAFRHALDRIRSKWPTARPRWYCTGPEKGVADLMGDIDARPCTADKFVRAQPSAAAWNAGKILVLRGSKWLDPFVREVCSFTGVADAHDDQVDALAAAFDSFANVAPFRKATLTQRETSLDW